MLHPRPILSVTGTEFGNSAFNGTGIGWDFWYTLWEGRTDTHRFGDYDINVRPFRLKAFDFFDRKKSNFLNIHATYVKVIRK